MYSRSNLYPATIKSKYLITFSLISYSIHCLLKTHTGGICWDVVASHFRRENYLVKKMEGIKGGKVKRWSDNFSFFVMFALETLDA